MNFSEKLRTLRKQYKLSQEQLAEKINVSRQAITKWETEGGLPDIENLLAIAALFSVSLDELLSEEKLICKMPDYAYESVTEYDISCPTQFDIHVPGAAEVVVATAENEKLRVRLASNVLQTLPRDYKAQLDEHRNRMDVDIRRVGQSSEAEGKKALVVHVSLPARYCEGVELSVSTEILRLNGTGFPIEFDGSVKSVYLDGVKGVVALNCNTDMDIYADELPDAIEINQINATSTLHIACGTQCFTKVKGKSNRIRFTIDGKPAESSANADAECRIELAGMNSELLVDQRTVK